MNRIPTLVLAVTSLFAVTALPAQAAADTSRDTTFRTATDDGDSRAWRRYRDYPNILLCEAAGAAGVVAGRWNDWRCDDDNVLWVDDDEDDDFPDDPDWP